MSFIESGACPEGAAFEPTFKSDADTAAPFDQETSRLRRRNVIPLEAAFWLTVVALFRAIKSLMLLIKIFKSFIAFYRRNRRSGGVTGR